MKTSRYICPHCGHIVRASTYAISILKYLSSEPPFPRHKHDIGRNQRTPQGLAKKLDIPIAMAYRTLRQLSDIGCVEELSNTLCAYRGHRVGIYTITEKGRKELEANAIPERQDTD